MHLYGFYINGGGKAAKASSQKEWTEAMSLRLSAVRSSSTSLTGGCTCQRDERRQVADLLQYLRRVLGSFSRSPSSSAPISLPWTFNGAMHLNQTLEMFPVEA